MGLDGKADANKDKLAGNVKKGAGKVTGDSETEAEGEDQELKGKLKNAATEAKDSVKGFKDGLKND